MIISIDGPAGSGKSTIANIISEKLGFIHFVSGSLYRAIAAHLLSENFDFTIITENFPVFNFNLAVKYFEGVQHIFVNNIDYTSRLRDNEVSTHSPYVSINLSIRNIIDNCQREFGLTNNLVVDGRDIGSHVFPNAEYKFYLDCDVKERAKRRFAEEKNKNSNITLEEIETQIKQRDFIDKTRKFAPLVVPNNATIIDSTNLSIEEVVEKIMNLIK